MGEEKDFQGWMRTKERLHASMCKAPFFKEGEVWWCNFGENIGVEINGKGDIFTRPVFILKKYNHLSFLGLPMTTRRKDGSWYFKMKFREIEQTVILSQGRVLDHRRLDRRMGEVPVYEANKLREAFLGLHSGKITSRPYGAGVVGNPKDAFSIADDIISSTMLSPSHKLNPKIFDKDVEQVPVRKGFGLGLLDAGEADKNVVGLCADLTDSTQMNLFRDKFPERFVQMGVAEQNLATVASGMAAMGKVPFITSYAMFSPGRNWEQIRTTIAYNDVPVKIVGSHAGISVGPDGGTHQAIEDIALMRAIPNMVVISPCDAVEARKATVALAKTGSPAYIRLIRDKTPVMTTDETPFEIGKAQTFFEPIAGKPEVAIIATGALVHKALVAARELEKEKVGVRVINLSTIKPLDEGAIVRAARDAGAIVTVEEHQVIGGMGSAVAELLSAKLPVPIEFIGVHDKFGQSGTPAELVEHYHMGSSHIVDAARRAIARRVKR